MKIYTGGTFDCPHVGHLYLFQRIKKMFPNSHLVVSLNTDEFITKFKGKPPLFSYKEREELLKLFFAVDEIISNVGGEDSKPAILSVEPDLIVIGSDWLKKDYCKQMGFTPEWLEQHDISLLYIPYTKGISTTMIKERLNAK